MAIISIKLALHVTVMSLAPDLYSPQASAPPSTLAERLSPCLTLIHVGLDLDLLRETVLPSNWRETVPDSTAAQTLPVHVNFSTVHLVEARKGRGSFFSPCSPTLTVKVLVII